MKKIKLLLITLFALLIVFKGLSVFAGEIVIIANRDYPGDSISLLQLKDIYLGEVTMIKDVRIKPVEQKDELIRRKFIERVTGLSVSGYKAYWIKKFFQEGTVPPLIKSSAREVIEAVKQNRGGIGYIWADEAKNLEGIKILLRIKIDNGKYKGQH